LLSSFNIKIAGGPQIYDGLTATNPLLYELTGGTNLGTANNKGGNLVVFNPTNGINILPALDYTNVFNRDGIANSDPVEPHNFFQPAPSPKEYAPYASPSGAPQICGLIVPVALYMSTANTSNFWHYDSSSPYRHNMNSYDLWAEFSIGSKNGQQTMITNGNWQ
jgi:hypothetical protein